VTVGDAVDRLDGLDDEDTINAEEPIPSATAVVARERDVGHCRLDSEGCLGVGFGGGEPTAHPCSWTCANPLPPIQASL
jgi:hypothetical protein